MSLGFLSLSPLGGIILPAYFNLFRQEQSSR